MLGSVQAGLEARVSGVARRVCELADVCLAGTDGVGSDVDSGAKLIDAIAELEVVKSACAAAQARLTAALVEMRTAGLTRGQARERRAVQSAGKEVGLARRESPTRGRRHAALATVLIRELPHTLAALTGGEITEWQATLVARETATLSHEHRRAVDAELAGHWYGLGDAGIATAAARAAYRLDAQQAVDRARRAEADRRVSIRPAPDCMAYVTAMLPLTHGVAVYAALRRHADTAKAAGESRGGGQLMADEFVARLAAPRSPAAVPAAALVAARGDADAAATTAPSDDETTDAAAGLAGLPAGVDVEIQLVMTDRALFDGDDEPALLTGYGAIPAPLARRLLRCTDQRTRVWLRRVYADPRSGHLTSADTRRRLFPAAARRFLITRDQTCRVPWCGAPIRHIDHIDPYAAGGDTSIANGQGLCAACNQSKAAPGWHAEVDTNTASSDGGPTTIRIAAPTGHHYLSRSPAPPRSRPWGDISFVERKLVALVLDNS